MLNEIINQYFDEEVNQGTDTVWGLHDKVEKAVELYKAGEISADVLDEIIAKYVYEAEKRAITWTYSKCAMAVFGRLMMGPEDMGCCKDCVG